MSKYILLNIKPADSKYKLQAELQEKLYSYIEGISMANSCTALAVSGNENEVSCLLEISNKDITDIKLITAIKRNSERWLQLQGKAYKDFTWNMLHKMEEIEEDRLEEVKRNL